MVTWVAKRWHAFRLARKINQLDKRMESAGAGAERSRMRLHLLSKRLNEEREHVAKVIASAERRLRDIGETLVIDIREAEEAQRRYEEELESLRVEKRILEQTTIPALVAAHKLALERIDADIAVQVKRQVSATTE